MNKCTFEEAIIRIDNEISIQQSDREVYTKDYDEIRYYLMDIMKQTDPVFEKIYAGPSLFGSYIENIKIEAPDEFDVHFLLKLPFFEHIKLELDPARPGFVRLSLAKPLLLMKREPELLFVYKQFIKLVGGPKRRKSKKKKKKKTEQKYLRRNKIHNWLGRIIEDALKTYGNEVPSTDGMAVYELKYLKRGTAHTIKAKSISRKISIDFVPAFKFNANEDWFAERPFPENVKEKLWFAVPKPSCGPKHGRSLTFSIVVPQIEKHLLINKYNLKPSLRLFKSIRDKMKDRYKIKSYFIKTLYLFENENQDDNFWMQPPGKILLHMIDLLLLHLENKCMPFYWCPSMNLLDNFEMATEYIRKFEAVKQSLELFSMEPEIRYSEIRRLFGPALKKSTTIKMEIA